MQYIRQDQVIEIEICLDRGGKLDVITGIDSLLIIGKILGHVKPREMLAD